jgi:branched-chain amino acid transport system substrate-binding protein
MIRLRGITVLMFMVAVLAIGSIGHPAEPIIIGSVEPSSPPGSIAQGSEAVAGIKLAVKMINERGGILGRPVEVQFEDSMGIPEKGRAATERLISKGKVSMIVGGNHSSVCMAMSDVAHEYRIPYVNVNCWADAIREKGYAEWFNTSVNNSRIAVGGAEFVKSLGVKRVVVLPENTDFGIGLARGFTKHLKSIAPEIACTDTVLDREAKDFTPAILGLAKDPPDVVVPIMDPPAGYIIINQLFEYGVAPTAKTWMLDLDALAELPDFWDNVSEGGKYLTGIALFHPNMKLTDLGKEVRKQHMDKAGREASRVVFQGFDAVWVAADAIKRAGKLEADAVIKALRETKLVGTRGTITFSTERGPFFQQWVEVPYSIIQFTKVKQPLAEAPIVFPPGQATAKPVKR